MGKFRQLKIGSNSGGCIAILNFNNVKYYFENKTKFIAF